jgi:hypothetical protein
MSNEKHGMTVLRRTLDEVADRGRKVIDERTKLGKELMRWRGELVADLGGQEGLSTQQLALVDICMRTKLLLDSVDAWLLRQPSIIDKRKRQLFPVVQQCTALADALARHLGTLGIARAARQVPRLDTVSVSVRRIWITLQVLGELSRRMRAAWVTRGTAARRNRVPKGQVCKLHTRTT